MLTRYRSINPVPDRIVVWKDNDGSIKLRTPTVFVSQDDRSLLINWHVKSTLALISGR